MDRYKYEKESADKIADIVNKMTFDNKEFCKAMGTQHRTLQQSFTRMCMNWLEYCASDEYAYDGRNEDSHYVAKKIFELAKENDVAIWIPYV